MNSTNFAIAPKYFNKSTIQLNWLYKISNEHNIKFSTFNERKLHFHYKKGIVSMDVKVLNDCYFNIYTGFNQFSDILENDLFNFK